MTSLAIDIEQLKFSYESGPRVLDIPSLRVRRGEHVFLYGPSGCGKTTLLGLITGVLPCQQGQVRLLEQDFSAMPSNQRDAFRGNHLGYVFQMFNLIPYLNVRQNIELPTKLNPIRKEKVDRFQGEWLKDLALGLDIEPLLDKDVRELSVGQQQRVAAARALAGHPEIVVCDEPTSALDLDRRKDFINLLFDQAERYETTVVFVSHDHSLKDLFHRAISLPEINVGARA